MQIKAISIFVLQISSLLAYAAPAGQIDQQTPSPAIIPDAQNLATGPTTPSPQDDTAGNTNADPGRDDLIQKIGRAFEAAAVCIMSAQYVTCPSFVTAAFEDPNYTRPALDPEQELVIQAYRRRFETVSECMLRVDENLAAKKKCWNLLQPQDPSTTPPATSGSSLNAQQQNFLDNITKSVKQSAACFTAQGVQATSCFEPITKTFTAAQQNPASLQ